MSYCFRTVYHTIALTQFVQSMTNVKSEDELNRKDSRR